MIYIDAYVYHVYIYSLLSLYVTDPVQSLGPHMAPSLPGLIFLYIARSKI